MLSDRPTSPDMRPGNFFRCSRRTAIQSTTGRSWHQMYTQDRGGPGKDLGITGKNRGVSSDSKVQAIHLVC